MPNAPTPVQELEYNDFLARVAKDIAMEMLNNDEIMVKWHLTEADYTLLLRNEMFVAMIRQAQADWIAEPPTRIRAKATAILEDGLAVMDKILWSDAPPMAKISAFQRLTELSGMAPQKQKTGELDGEGRERFSVQIVLGGGQSLSIAGSAGRGTAVVEMPVIEGEAS